MAKRKPTAGDTDRIYRVGLADPRTPRERVAAMINRAVQPRAIKGQHRKYDDDDATRARHKEAAAGELKKRGVRSSSPKRKRSKS